MTTYADLTTQTNMTAQSESTYQHLRHDSNTRSPYSDLYQVRILIQMRAAMSGAAYKSDLVPEASLLHHRTDAFTQRRIALRLECNGPTFRLDALTIRLGHTLVDLLTSQS